jgi:hypothetical protein
MFRPYSNAERFRHSARRMAMPELPEELFVEAITAIVDADRRFVPNGEGQSLYLRPVMIATEPAIGIRAAEEYLFAVIASPVDPIPPFPALYSATTPKRDDSKQEYFPKQKISMDQAIAAYTTGSAFAEFTEKQKGLIVPGMFADFVVLDRDITAVVPQKLLATRVVRTVVGGKTVYEAK